MADIVDIANDYADEIIARALLSNKVEEKKHYKLCRNCREATQNGDPFCDSDCRDDFEKRQKHGANNT